MTRQQVVHIVDDVVVNISIGEVGSNLEYPHEVVFVPAEKPVGIGWIRTNGEFTDPRPPVGQPTFLEEPTE